MTDTKLRKKELRKEIREIARERRVLLLEQRALRNELYDLQEKQ